MTEQMNAEERARLRERLANQEHERWARWMKYLFDQCWIKDGQFVIPGYRTVQWQRQIGTPYSELSEQEKETDRGEANNTLLLLDNAIKVHGESERVKALREAIKLIKEVAPHLTGLIESLELEMEVDGHE